MELELSLSPPTHNQQSKGFDLNSNINTYLGFEEDRYSSFKQNQFFANKQSSCFDDHEGRCSSETRFPLVSWNGYPNEDDQDGWDEQNKRISHGSDPQLEMDGEGEGLIGWPPVNTWRKKLMEEGHQFEGLGVVNGNHIAGQMEEEFNGGNNNAMNNNDHNNNNNDSFFVKVKMDGVAVARKIDLNRFHSYQMLTTYLNHIFGKYQGSSTDGASYNLMYQDQEGEWLLAGEVPWQTFIETVKRIHVVRN